MEISRVPGIGCAIRAECAAGPLGLALCDLGDQSAGSCCREAAGDSGAGHPSKGAQSKCPSKDLGKAEAPVISAARPQQQEKGSVEVACPTLLTFPINFCLSRFQLCFWLQFAFPPQGAVPLVRKLEVLSQGWLQCFVTWLQFVKLLQDLGSCWIQAAWVFPFQQAFSSSQLLYAFCLVLHKEYLSGAPSLGQMLSLYLSGKAALFKYKGMTSKQIYSSVKPCVTTLVLILLPDFDSEAGHAAQKKDVPGAST